jgi:rapamycin-insensitive companion of mTOR
MRVLLRANVQDFSDWGITFLVQQLDDEHVKVSQLALSILDEACDEAAMMETFVMKMPGRETLYGLGDGGKQLWLRYV